MKESVNPSGGVISGANVISLNEPATTSDRENRNGVSNGIRSDPGDGSTNNSHHSVVQLEMISKRAMEVNSGRDSVKNRRMDHDFNALLMLPGIDPTTPINFVR